MSTQPDNIPAEESSDDEAVASPNQQVQNASEPEIAQFVSQIKNIEQQIGEHVLRALQHPETMAVLTTVVAGPGGQQHLVSAAINPAKMAEISRLLQKASEEREEEVMCVGFHCLVRPKGENN